MMKRLFSIALILFNVSTSAFTQTTNCGQAVAQLQSYAGQINQFYSNEYWRIIPNVRCPAYDQFGQPFNPIMVQNCRLQTLGYLNAWYGQQCAYVNNWYAQIATGCAVQPPSRVSKPAPLARRGSEENPEIDTEEIEDLTAGIDEDKAIKISIPKTATGFKSR